MWEFFSQLLIALIRTSPGFAPVRFDAAQRRLAGQIGIAVERTSPAFAATEDSAGGGAASVAETVTSW
jgi:hypothetical protein